MNDDLLEATFRRASAALDEAWQLVREERASRHRVDTLSNSLANPREAQLELTLSNARTVIQCDADRDALTSIARTLLDQGRISKDAFERLAQDFAC